MSITLEGLDEVLEALEKVGNAEKLEQNLGKACALVEGAAKDKAPVDNGDLRCSIVSKVENLEGIIYTPLEYAPYVEYGTGLFAEGGGRTDVPWNYKDDKGNWHTTSGQNPQPFMRPALNENREKIIEILKEGLLND